MSPEAQERFDTLLQDAIDALPEGVRALLDEVSVVVLDRPSEEMVRQLRRDGTIDSDADGLDLCGLHTGTALTERSVEHEGGRLPNQVHLFREGIVALALSTEEIEGDWREWERKPDGGMDEEVYEEIRITLLHEIGHHFGLDEDDLDDLGYG